MKTIWYVFALAIAASSLPTCRAQARGRQQSNVRLTSTEFRTIATACAPDVPLVTLQAIARAESAFPPYAPSLDYPRRTAREHGLRDGGIFLARQPGNLAEARAWTHWLLERGRSVSIGLVQISTQHAADLGTSIDQLLDPCTNVRVGAQILTEEYQRAAAVWGGGQEALRQALSEYNSGSPVLGFDNGYVNSIVNGEVYPKRLR